MSSPHASAATSYAVGAGILSGLLYGGIFGGAAGGLLFGYFAPLPLFALGLACGVGASVTASAFGALIALLLGGSFGVGFYVLVNVAPVILLLRRALAADPGGPSGGATGAGARTGTESGAGAAPVAWYPPGRLLVWMSAVAAALLGAFWLAALGLESGAHGVVDQFVARMTDVGDGPFRPGADDDGSAVAFQAIVGVFPGVLLASWMIMVIINGLLAQGLVARFGRPVRPSPGMSDLRVADWIGAAFTGTLAGGLLVPGPFDFLLQNLAVVLAIPCFFSGLAVVHAFTKRFEGRLPVLVGFYALMLLTVWPVALLVAVGAADPWLDLRQRLRPPDSGQET